MAEENKKKRENKRKTILVVDDESMVVELIRRYLETEEYGVVSALSAEEGWEEYKRVKPNLVLTDLRMSAATGVDLLRWIRGKDLSIPVIILTGYPDMDSAIEAIKLGADDYISKPFGLEILLKAIEQCLDMSPAELEIRHLKTYASLLAEENKKLREQLDQFFKDQEDKSASEDISKYKAICGAAVHNLHHR